MRAGIDIRFYWLGIIGLKIAKIKSYCLSTPVLIGVDEAVLSKQRVTGKYQTGEVQAKRGSVMAR
jgi:hypothetical protein